MPEKVRKKELVQLYLPGLAVTEIFCERQSNLTLLVKRSLVDGNKKSHIIDLYGHFYVRDKELEQFTPEYYVYCMI